MKIDKTIAVSVVSAAVLCGCAHSGDQSPSLATQSKPTEWNNNETRLSPFTRVQYDGDKVRVTCNGTEYQLAAINSLPVSDILNFCKSSYGEKWQRRFAEDLVPVLNDMDHPINTGNTVSLSLIDPQSGKRQEMPNVLMTQQNRMMVHKTFEADHPADERTAGN